MFIGISNSSYNATVQVLVDEYGIPFMRQVLEDFDNAHTLVERVKNQITKYFH